MFLFKYKYNHMEFLHQLGIKPNNNGTSTGIQSWSEDRVLESYSPVMNNTCF